MQKSVKISNMQMPQPLPGAGNFEQTATSNSSVPAWKAAMKFSKKAGLSLQKRDPVGDKLKDFGIKEEDEIKEIKELNKEILNTNEEFDNG